MPRGRPHRRESSSSVESLDISQVRWSQEASLVKAAPKDEDPINHVLFELKDVTIFDPRQHDGAHSEPQSSSNHPNVLELRVKGPFSARGTLIIEDDKDQLARVFTRRPRQIPMEVRTVHQFSIGETETQRPCIWILGRCGAWYEVVPSAAYKPTYMMMAEGVYLYYRFIDFYSNPEERVRMPGKRDEITWLFFQYALRVGDGSTYEDVAERCEKHAVFLFYQFETERELTVEPAGEVISWHTTEFYKWLKKRRNDALTAVQRALKEPLIITRDVPIRHQALPVKTSPPLGVSESGKLKIEPRSQSRASEYSSSESSDDSGSGGTSSIPASRPDAGNFPPTHRPAETHVAPRDTANSVTTPQHPLKDEDKVAVLTLVEAIKVTWASTRNRPVKASSIVQSIYMKYKFPDMRAIGSYKKGVEEVMHYYARALIEEPTFEPFHGTELHAWLLEKASIPFRYEGLGPDKFPFLVTPRKKVERASREDNRSTGDESSHPTTGGKRLPRGRPRKSALSLGSSRKRPYAEIDGNSDEESENKRSFYFSEGDDTVDDTAHPLDEEADSQETTVSYGELVDFVIRSEPLPSLDTKRSDGAWVCHRNGCDYVVRGETEASAQARIQQHITQHAPLRCGREGCDFAVLDDDADVAKLRMEQHNSALHGPWKCEHEGCDFFARQENGVAEQRRVQEHIASHEREQQKLNLAKSESRPHLPIDHLLEKIRALGRRQDEARASASSAATVPRTNAEAQLIKRKLMM